MSSPFFYISHLADESGDLTLPEETSHHVVQVLRMLHGEKIWLTNGKGKKLLATITEPHRKKCRVAILERYSEPESPRKTAIAISLLKNTSRFEWFLEKAAEIGISEIIPLVCERTEKHSAKTDRFKSVLVSAMLQSQQVWITEMGPPVSFKDFCSSIKMEHRYIAHCQDAGKETWEKLRPEGNGSRLVLIGPEGDFTPKEIEWAIENGWKPLSLGETRLRTETAGLVAAVLMKNL